MSEHIISTVQAVPQVIADYNAVIASTNYSTPTPTPAPTASSTMPTAPTDAAAASSAQAVTHIENVAIGSNAASVGASDYSPAVGFIISRVSLASDVQRPDVAVGDAVSHPMQTLA